MIQEHFVLIYLSVDLVVGLSELKQMVSALQEKVQIQAISSVYKRYLTHRSEDLNSELIAVIKGACTLEAFALKELLIKKKNGPCFCWKSAQKRPTSSSL